MKLKKKILIGILALCGVACTVAACAQDESPYADLNDQGYTVSVKYDINGGTAIGSLTNLSYVHVYSLSDQKTVEHDGKECYEITLLQPGSSALDDGLQEDKDVFSESGTRVSRTGYFLAGWYQNRTLRVDESGNALDEDGNLCSVSGKDQGYEYSGYWDFDDDKLYVEADESYSSSSPIITLYAGWIPEYKFTFMAQLPVDEDSSEVSWQEIGSTTFNPMYAENTISVPTWNEETGAQDLNDFSSLSGKTFLAAYSDEACEAAYTGATIEHTGTYDIEKGVSVGGEVIIYTTWQDGTWYHITTAAQLNKNARNSGCYEIYADLDFTGVTWPAAFYNGSFTGKFISVGGAHTISNITASQTNNTRLYGGLFGELAESSVIENISFANATFSVIGCRYAGASYGLLAGNIYEGATLTNVTVSGTLKLTRDACNLYFQRNPSVGLLYGYSTSDAISDISLDNITYELPTDDPNYTYSAEVAEGSGAITLTRTYKES